MYNIFKYDNLQTSLPKDRYILLRDQQCQYEKHTLLSFTYHHHAGPLWL
jgi:hypothetical protein